MFIDGAYMNGEYSNIGYKLNLDELSKTSVFIRPKSYKENGSVKKEKTPKKSAHKPCFRCIFETYVKKIDNNKEGKENPLLLLFFLLF